MMLGIEKNNECKRFELVVNIGIHPNKISDK